MLILCLNLSSCTRVEEMISSLQANCAEFRDDYLGGDDDEYQVPGEERIHFQVGRLFGCPNIAAIELPAV